MHLGPFWKIDLEEDENYLARHRLGPFISYALHERVHNLDTGESRERRYDNINLAYLDSDLPDGTYNLTLTPVDLLGRSYPPGTVTCGPSLLNTSGHVPYVCQCQFLFLRLCLCLLFLNTCRQEFTQTQKHARAFTGTSLTFHQDRSRAYQPRSTNIDLTACPAMAQVWMSEALDGSLDRVSVPVCVCMCVCVCQH